MSKSHVTNQDPGRCGPSGQAIVGNRLVDQAIVQSFDDLETAIGITWTGCPFVRMRHENQLGKLHSILERMFPDDRVKYCFRDEWRKTSRGALNFEILCVAEYDLTQPWTKSLDEIRAYCFYRSSGKKTFCQPNILDLAKYPAFVQILEKSERELCDNFRLVALLARGFPLCICEAVLSCERVRRTREVTQKIRSKQGGILRNAQKWQWVPRTFESILKEATGQRHLKAMLYWGLLVEQERSFLEPRMEKPQVCGTPGADLPVGISLDEFLAMQSDSDDEFEPEQNLVEEKWRDAISFAVARGYVDDTPADVWADLARARTHTYSSESDEEIHLTQINHAIESDVYDQFERRTQYRDSFELQRSERNREVHNYYHDPLKYKFDESKSMKDRPDLADFYYNELDLSAISVAEDSSKLEKFVSRELLAENRKRSEEFRQIQQEKDLRDLDIMERFQEEAWEDEVQRDLHIGMESFVEMADRELENHQDTLGDECWEDLQKLIKKDKQIIPDDLDTRGVDNGTDYVPEVDPQDLFFKIYQSVVGPKNVESVIQDRFDWMQAQSGNEIVEEYMEWRLLPDFEECAYWQGFDSRLGITKIAMNPLGSTSLEFWDLYRASLLPFREIFIEKVVKSFEHVGSHLSSFATQLKNLYHKLIKQKYSVVNDPRFEAHLAADIGQGNLFLINPRFKFFMEDGCSYSDQYWDACIMLVAMALTKFWNPLNYLEGMSEREFCRMLVYGPGSALSWWCRMGSSWRVLFIEMLGFFRDQFLQLDQMNSIFPDMDKRFAHSIEYYTYLAPEPLQGELTINSALKKRGFLIAFDLDDHYCYESARVKRMSDYFNCWHEDDLFDENLKRTLDNLFGSCLIVLVNKPAFYNLEHVDVIVGPNYRQCSRLRKNREWFSLTELDQREICNLAMSRGLPYMSLEQCIQAVEEYSLRIFEEKDSLEESKDEE